MVFRFQTRHQRTELNPNAKRLMYKLKNYEVKQNRKNPQLLQTTPVHRHGRTYFHPYLLPAERVWPLNPIASILAFMTWILFVYAVDLHLQVGIEPAGPFVPECFLTKLKLISHPKITPTYVTIEASTSFAHCA